MLMSEDKQPEDLLRMHTGIHVRAQGNKAVLQRDIAQISLVESGSRGSGRVRVVCALEACVAAGRPR